MTFPRYPECSVNPPFTKIRVSIYHFSSEVLPRNVRTAILTTLMVTMIPVSSPRDSMMACRHPYLYRQVWVPANAAVSLSLHPLGCPAKPQLSIPIQRQQDNRVVLSAREDEICAAKVLLNLSPKDQKLVHSIAPMSQQALCNTNIAFRSASNGNSTLRTVPGTIDVPSGYVRQWHDIYNQEKTQSIPLRSPPCHISEPSSSEDESLSSDESVSPHHTSDSAELNSATGECHQGSISLALAEDVDVLSRLHCFMRRYCVEVFSASPEDVAVPRYGKSHGVKVIAGQVGIRCLFCKHRKAGRRPERAVCFPSSLRNIYHSIETWQRRHSVVCEDIPTWVRQSLMELTESSKSRAGGRRQYWEDSAKLLGLVDTPCGIRFSRQPGDLRELESFSVRKPATPSKPVVHRDDREFITDYLFVLMDQMETCQFTEEDRSGGRSKIKDIEVGLPGMQCKHCQGKAGFGRYFPTSVNALALANSDRNIFNHLQKCRRCPIPVKSQLLQLSKNQSQPKNRRGLRKMFFQRVWSRIHEEA